MQPPGKTRIISDGTMEGTRVLVDGVEMDNVSEITITARPADGVVVANIEVFGLELDVVALVAHIVREEPAPPVPPGLN